MKCNVTLCEKSRLFELPSSHNVALQESPSTKSFKKSMKVGEKEVLGVLFARREVTMRLEVSQCCILRRQMTHCQAPASFNVPSGGHRSQLPAWPAGGTNSPSNSSGVSSLQGRTRHCWGPGMATNSVGPHCWWLGPHLSQRDNLGGTPGGNSGGNPRVPRVLRQSLERP